MSSRGRDTARRAPVAVRGPLALGASLLLGYVACSNVILSEESVRACSNGADDDDDGLTDCEDPSCDASGVCETTMQACTNGVDDDDDGLADCAEEACRAGGFCDAFEAECDPVDGTGCPAGMGCYLRFEGTSALGTRCRAAGVGVDTTTCDQSAIDALGASAPHPCRDGYGCNHLGADFGLCGRYCRADAECPRGGFCTGTGGAGATVGLCNLPCNPRFLTPCAEGHACISLHEIGEPYATGGARWFCYPVSYARGTASQGEPCVDPPTGATPAASVCRSSLACVPVGGTPTCREVCEVGGPPCSGGGSCTQPYSMPPSAAGDIELGVCL